MLSQSEDTYKELGGNHKAVAVTFGIIGGILAVIAITYCLLFFVFNKWIVVNGKPARAFMIGKKDEKVRLMKMNCIIIYRNKDEIFNSKKDVR